jgi:hypothetical protein
MSSPEKFKRNEHGLLESVDYVFNKDGSVNWRAMIPLEHLYPNKDWFERRKMPVPDSIEGLDDGQLLIKLSGIKELAKLRGFHNVTYDIVESSDTRVVVQCMINWIENYEGVYAFRPTFASIANATTHNTNGFAAKFLECIAENRAFVRCVRNFLNIHIVGADEIDSSKDKTPIETPTESADISPQGILAKNLKEKMGVSTFDSFKDWLRALYKEGKYDGDTEQVKTWASFKDIPAKDCRKLLKLL